MIAEPYICTRGPRAEEIEWVFSHHEIDVENSWIPYADFEREKLRQLNYCQPLAISVTPSGGYERGYWLMPYDSKSLIGYNWWDYCKDTESNRLLKRAGFLKAVCEKEGVSWPGECVCDAEGPCKSHGSDPEEIDIVKELCDNEPEECPCTVCSEHKPLNAEDYYTKAEIEKALDGLERHVDRKASRLVGLLAKDTYTREKIDERFGDLLSIIEFQQNALEEFGGKPKTKPAFRRLARIIEEYRRGLL